MTDASQTGHRGSSSEARPEQTPTHPQVIEPMEISDNPTAPSHSEVEVPVSKFRLLMVASALCLSLVLVGLDSNILATAIPSITNDFKTIADVAWYSAAFRLTSCCIQFVFGKAYTLFPPKTVLITAVVIFELGSLIDATAPSSKVFVLGRAICGIGQAGIYAGCFK